MGRGTEKKKLAANMLLGVLASFGRRQLTLVFCRYKYLVLVVACLLLVWVTVGETTSSSSRDPPGPLHLHSGVETPEDFPDFGEDGPSNKVLEPAPDETQNEINVKAAVHSVVRKHKEMQREDDKERMSLLSVPAQNQLPVRDIEKKKEVYRGDPSPRRRSNTLNGVKLNNQSPTEVDWAVVGGADIYRAQDLEGHNEFSEEFNKQVPGAGEKGDPVVLFGKEKLLGEEILKKEAFNLVASDKIVYTREVPDTRDPRCQAVVYDSVLPTTSVVIIYTNEAWSPLLRTIYSVLNRSPPETIHEIILVDDFSDKPHLGGKLERFIRKYFPSKVKLLRLKERQGLIRARLTGARAATGDVLLFLDSHCECNTGWLEPLLQRIKENPSAFVVPIIDVIDDKTMEYYHGNGNYFQVGGFTWSGHFTWIDISPEELARRGSPIAPTRSPTMAGGLFAVARKTFWELGSYDEEMDVWGGENLEMSFRIWQCGAELETIPCSRVGHIFRSFHPYSFPGNKDTHGINTARTVEVWMDEYKKLFYMNRPDLLSTDIGSLQRRLEFKAEKQCKGFDWFLQNIYPQKFILDSPQHVFAYGRLRNPSFDTCLDNLQNEEKDSYVLGEYACHKFMSSSQFFSFSRQFEIRREDMCAQVTAPFPQLHEPVSMTNCLGQGGAQEWAHTREGKIIHKATKMCLDGGLGNSMDSLYLAPCQNIPSQVWFFDHYITN